MELSFSGFPRCGLAAGLRVYSSPDGYGRCIRFDERRPPAPLVLVATFLEDEEDAAWELLLELGGQPRVSGRQNTCRLLCVERLSATDSSRTGV